MALTATFIDGDTFTVVGDYTANFIVGRKVRAWCGVNGYRYGIVSATAFAVNTTVDLDQIVDLSGNDSTLTANLESVEWSVVGVAATGNQWVRNEIEVERYASFSEAVDNIGADDRVLSISNTVAVAASKAVPTNVTLRFYQGGVLNIAGGQTVTINGFIDAGLYQIFTGAGGVAFGLGTSIKEVYPQWWGAAGDGVADDTAEIQTAIDSLPVLGADVVLPPGKYLISDTITIGDGTSLLVSTKQSIALVGSGCGQTDDDAFPIAGSTQLQWNGAAGIPMIQIDGPIGDVRIEDIFFDCKLGANAALNAIAVIHAHSSTFRRLVARQYSGYAYTITAYGPHPTSNQGASDNIWESVINGYPYVNTAGGMLVGSAVADGTLDVARNTWINCRFRGGTAGNAIELRYVDSSTFVNVLTTSNSGTGLLITPAVGNTAFPGAVVFYNCAIAGAVNVAGAGWTGNTPIFFWPYPIGDGEVVPTQNFAAGITNDGLLFGVAGVFEYCFRNNEYLYGRNVADNANIQVIGVEPSNDVLISGDSQPILMGGHTRPQGAAGVQALGDATHRWRQLFIDYENTATVGNVTINKASGRVRMTAGTAVVTVTNSFVTASTHIFCTIATNDATAILKNVVAGAGSFVIRTTANVTGITAVDFFLVNAD